MVITDFLFRNIFETSLVIGPILAVDGEVLSLAQSLGVALKFMIA